jgi:hypothetical protein
MSVTDSEPTVEAPAAVPHAPAYDTCEHCQAPVESTQRYCVVCGTRRRHVRDPAVRFLTEAGSRSRVRTGSRAPRHARRPSSGLGLALVLAAIPLAVAAGVLIGRPGQGSDSKLLAALRAQKPTVVNVGGGQSGSTTAGLTAAAGHTTTSVARLKSTFGLQQGYAVELRTLPGAGITAAKVATAERQARARGATAVGLINPSDFGITPAPPAGDYVIYSGQYRSSAAANAALAKLRHAFPSAKVIAIRSTAAGGSGPVLATTSYGSAHQVAGFKPTASQLSSGANVVKKVAKEINGGYVKSQQGLPDAIPVP